MRRGEDGEHRHAFHSRELLAFGRNLRTLLAPADQADHRSIRPDDGKLMHLPCRHFTADQPRNIGAERRNICQVRSVRLAGRVRQVEAGGMLAKRPLKRRDLCLDRSVQLRIAIISIERLQLLLERRQLGMEGIDRRIGQSIRIACIEINQPRNTPGIMHADPAQLLARNGVPDQHRPLDMERGHHRQHILPEPCDGIPGCRSARGAIASPRNAVDVVSLREQRRKCVVNMRGVPQPGEQDHRPSLSTPVQHLKPNTRVDRNHFHAMGRRVMKHRNLLRRAASLLRSSTSDRQNEREQQPKRPVEANALHGGPPVACPFSIVCALCFHCGIPCARRRLEKPPPRSTLLTANFDEKADLLPLPRSISHTRRARYESRERHIREGHMHTTDERTLTETSIPDELIALEEQYGAHNYHPLNVVIERAEGAWVTDIEGRRYLDFLAAYSAVNQGHCHPAILRALIEQAERVTLTSRAFRNDQLPRLLEDLHALTGFDMALPTNGGVEAVETALKIARKWGVERKGIPDGQAEVVVCRNNFHGRTIAVVGFSSDPQYRRGFGPFAPGFCAVPFGDAAAVAAAITDRTCAVFLEPIQGEAGILIPPDGYLRDLAAVCRERNVLLVLDEIQSGLGRTGKLFAFEHESVRPDMVTIGKALSGGFYPVSAVLGSREALGVLQPGDHGSTFGGNPLACAVARAALRVIVDERLPERSAELGAYALQRLHKMRSPYVHEVRGRGLWIGIELDRPARPFCERLAEEGVLSKETHEHVIRLAPPLVITREDLDWGLDRIERVLAADPYPRRPLSPAVS